jgi:phage77ORF036|nr:MAG TPA: YopX protein [Caudoviricetes sp.]
MSRDIKFRLWSKIGKKFIKTDDPDLNFVINSDGYLYSIENFYGEIYVSLQLDIVVLQFTGLQDINGKDIYEGDILKYNFPYDGRLKHVSPVKFLETEASFGIKDIYGNEIPLYRITANNYFEVVGNIYENPELLED